MPEIKSGAVAEPDVPVDPAQSQQACPPPPDPPNSTVYRDYTWLQRNQRPLVGLITVVGVLGLYYMFVLGKYNAESEKILLIVLGSLPGFMGYVLQYLFGGTAAADRQRQDMNQQRVSDGDVRFVRVRRTRKTGERVDDD